jgi:hypothetical protein
MGFMGPFLRLIYWFAVLFGKVDFLDDGDQRPWKFNERIGANSVGALWWRRLFLGPSVIALNLADADQVIAVPNLSAFLLRDHMFGILGKSQNRFLVFPVDGREARSVGISRRLNTQIALVALGIRPFVCTVLYVLYDQHRR